MLKSFDQLTEMLKARTVKRRVAVVAAHDRHSLEAVTAAARDNLVDPVLIGEAGKIQAILSELNFDAEQAQIINQKDPAEAAQTAADLARDGKVDCIMKGALQTATLMKVLVNREHGIRTGKVMSLVALMESPHYHKLFAITDPAILTSPSKEQKQDAIRNALDLLHALGLEKPKVAVLAAAEKLNPKLRESVEAAEIKEEGIPGCVIEGPISYDLAMDPDAAQLKGYESPVAGDADLLLVPDLASGNIASKSLTVLGGARMAGVVMGAKVPVLVVSRSAPADDKYMSIVAAALACGQ